MRLLRCRMSMGFVWVKIRAQIVPRHRGFRCNLERDAPFGRHFCAMPGCPTDGWLLDAYNLGRARLAAKNFDCPSKGCDACAHGLHDSYSYYLVNRNNYEAGL